MIGIQDLDVGIGGDVTRGDGLRAGHVDIYGLGTVGVKLGDDTLDIQNDLGHILLHAGNNRDLMLDVLNLDRRHSIALQRAEQNTAERVTERDAIAAFKGLCNKLAFAPVLIHFGNANIKFLKHRDTPPKLNKLMAAPGEQIWLLERHSTRKARICHGARRLTWNKVRR